MNEKLYSDYEALIINYINKYVDNRAVAEDLCHDTYVDFLEKFENPDTLDDTYARRWLLTAAKNNTLNYIKKASTRYELFHDDVQEALICEAETASDEDMQKELIYENLSKLSGVYYDVIVSRLQDVPVENMMVATGKSKHALECIYSRAVKKLKGYILESIKNI